MNRHALISILERTDHTPATARKAMAAAAVFIRENTIDEDAEEEASIEIRLGDGDATINLMLDLRKLQREIAEDEPETARRIDDAITRWEKGK